VFPYLRANVSPFARQCREQAQSTVYSNGLIERFWRSLKYEHEFLHANADLVSAQADIGGYIAYYNGRRRHSSLGRRTPDAVCAGEGHGEVLFARHVRSSGGLTQGIAA
jgi:transposase InsO family protein